MTDKQQVLTACAFIYRDDKLLIAKRAHNKSFLPNKYELPGGHVEFGETMEEGLIRELKEEMSIDIKVEIPFHVFTYLSDKNTVHNVEVDYLAQIINPSQDIKLNPEDHSEYRWISVKEIDKYFDESDAEKQAVKRGFELIKTYENRD